MPTSYIYRLGSDGGYAEYVILDGNFAFHLEENLSFREIR